MKAKPFQIAPDAAPAKQAILKAALKLFAARGIDGVTIRDVAEEAGFTNPALYKHYKSKEAMAADLFETCYREMVARMEAPLRQDLPFHGSLDEYLRALMELYEAAPGMVRVDYPLGTVDDGRSREVGAFYVLHEVQGAQLRVVDQINYPVNDLAEIVRRYIRGHAHRDTR